MQQAEKHTTQREREDEEFIVHLVGKVVTVSVETVRLVNELAQAVKMEDWMNGDDRTELIERVIDE